MNNKVIQLLDIQNNCHGLFERGSLVFDGIEKFLSNYSLTWKHSPILEDKDYTYLYVLSRGENLVNFSPNPGIFSEFKSILESHKRAAITANIDLEKHCFFDLIPNHQLLGWFHARQEALENIALSINKKQDYEILHKAHILASNISRQNIIFADKKGKVKYNIFGSATGRFTTEKKSIPVLTLKKEQRCLLKPVNDALVELDLNAAEIRMLLALSGKEQPKQDIHEWSSKVIFDSKLSREEIKTKTFAWLYNFSAPKSQLDKFFSRQIFRDFYNLQKEELLTPFGRNLKVDVRKAQNYLLQSATSDQVVENAYKIQNLLRDKKSNIAFTLHDSIILDMSKEDAILLREIKSIFETTRWGRFPSTCKIGKSFGSLREIKI